MLSKEDRGSIKMLRAGKGCGANRLLVESPRKTGLLFLWKWHACYTGLIRLDLQTANPAVVDVALRALTRTLNAWTIIWKNDWLKTGVALIRTLLNQWRDRRLRKCIRAKGGHFEHRSNIVLRYSFYQWHIYGPFESEKQVRVHVSYVFYFLKNSYLGTLELWWKSLT